MNEQNENLEVDVLNDADLETVAGGSEPNIIVSAAANACCPTSSASES
jgi:hypothetical protein